METKYHATLFKQSPLQEREVRCQNKCSECTENFKLQSKSLTVDLKHLSNKTTDKSNVTWKNTLWQKNNSTPTLQFCLLRKKPHLGCSETLQFCNIQYVNNAVSNILM